MSQEKAEPNGVRSIIGLLARSHVGSQAGGIGGRASSSLHHTWELQQGLLLISCEPCSTASVAFSFYFFFFFLFFSFGRGQSKTEDEK